MFYVRQSLAHQVRHKRESQTLQYAMRDRLTQLGWAEVEVSGDGLCCSAASGVARAGFKRMVAKVCLGKVGAVVAPGASRFACKSGDWQQLVEMCRVVDALLRKDCSREQIAYSRFCSCTRCPTFRFRPTIPKLNEIL